MDTFIITILFLPSDTNVYKYVYGCSIIDIQVVKTYKSKNIIYACAGSNVREGKRNCYMKYKAGERLKFLRELMGLSREEFAQTIEIDVIRLRNMEQKRCRVCEDEFAKIGFLFPEIIPWFLFEGDINLELLKSSDKDLLRLVAAKIEAGQFPKGAEFEKKIK